MFVFCLRENVRVKDIMQEHHSMSKSSFSKAKQLNTEETFDIFSIGS